MILVILGICILTLVIGLIIYNKTIVLEDVSLVALISGIGIGISLIATVMLGIEVSKLSTIDSQIKMYQEENEKIEQQVANVITQYQEYEEKNI